LPGRDDPWPAGPQRKTPARGKDPPRGSEGDAARRQRTGHRVGYRAAAGAKTVFTGTRAAEVGAACATPAVADGEAVVATDSQQMVRVDTIV
jgi:hypothetical protein